MRPAAAPSRSDTRRNGGAEGDRAVATVRHLRPARRPLRDEREHLLGEEHQVLVVAVRLVELQHREFGIVLRRHPFVPEVAGDLVHAIHAADREPLQIQLRRDAQVQIHVERVVVCHERPRHGPAGDRLHHRRLDFEVPAIVQEAPDRREQAAPHLEHAPRIRVDDQIEVALAVADLHVLQPVPLLGQRQMALARNSSAARPDRELVGLRAEQVARDTDVVAEVEQTHHLVVALRDRVLPHVHLDPLTSVRQHQKGRLAEAADDHDTAGRRRLDA